MKNSFKFVIIKQKLTSLQSDLVTLFVLSIYVQIIYLLLLSRMKPTKQIKQADNITFQLYLLILRMIGFTTKQMVLRCLHLWLIPSAKYVEPAQPYNRF